MSLERFFNLTRPPRFKGPDPNWIPEEQLIGMDTIQPYGFVADGVIAFPNFATGIVPPRVVTALPTLPDATYPQGSIVFLTTDKKLYRNTDGSTWERRIDGGLDIVADSIVAGSVAAGAIGVSELAANAVTADKLTVGSKPAFNEVLNGSFEDAGGSTNGWTKEWYTEQGAPVTNAVNASFHTSGTYSLEMRCAGGVNTGALANAAKSFPVVAGEVYYLSADARSGVASVDGFFFRLSYGTVEDFTFAQKVGDLTVASDIGLSASSWGPFQGYVTIPAGAFWARVNIWQYQPTTQTPFYVDNIICYRVASGVKNSDGNVVIDSTGIAVTNGKITVTNAGATVIIDGTSNMFKIQATGTLTTSAVTGPTASAVATATITGGAPAGAVPQHLAQVYRATAQTKRWGSYYGDNPGFKFVAVTSGGSPTTEQVVAQAQAIMIATPTGTDDLQMRLEWYNSIGSSWAAGGRYYVLKEAGI